MAFLATDDLTGLFGESQKDGNIMDLLATAQNDPIGWGSLAFGGFRAFRSKRVNIMTLALIVFGMWKLGMISNVIPRNSDGSINWIMIAICAVLPPTAAALIGGAPGLIISTLSRMIWKRRRRYYRRSRRYFRRYRRYYRIFRTYRRRYKRY